MRIVTRLSGDRSHARVRIRLAVAAVGSALALALLTAAAHSASSSRIDNGGTPPNYDAGAVAQAALTDFGGPDPSDKNGPLAKVGYDLAVLYEQYLFASRNSVSLSSLPVSSLIHVEDGKVILDVTSDGDPNVLVRALQGIGMEGTATAGYLVSGRLPVGQIGALAALPGVRAARAAMWTTHIGAVTSQGDSSMHSSFVRSAFGINGTGETVGVLSDSYNFLGGAAADIASGDLPGPGNPNGFTTAINVIQDNGKTDEGRAMLQIVHDVAPGAHLMFATANGGEANFATNIGKLRAAGCNIIVDDVGYFAEPMFQDGVIAQACDATRAAGDSYYSAAGNEARAAYESPFNSGAHYNSGDIPSAGGAPAFLGGTAHAFSTGPEDDFQSFTIGGNGTLTVALEWDQPFASVSGGSGCQVDVDFYLLNAAHTQVVGGSVNNNIGNDAVEVIQFTNPSSSAQNYNLMIVLHSGAAPGKIKYVSFSGPANNHLTNSGSIYGHPNALGAYAVGAAAYFSTPAFGTSPPVIENFSSAGTTPILFTTSGAATFDARAHKPDITAPDGGDNTFFGGDRDGNGLPNFSGTSAAAPHAAAVAALLKQAKSSATPSDIESAMESTALDMDVAGFDNNTGAGLVQAQKAIESLVPCTLTCPSDVEVSNDATLCGATVTFSAPGASGLCGEVTTSPASGSFFPVGTTTVHASSNAGSSCTFSVKVNDTEKPSIHCPAPISVECTGNNGALASNPAIVAFLAAATAHDNCPGIKPIQNDAPGFFPLGPTTVTFSVEDAVGNKNSCTSTVTVVDTKPPVISASASPAVIWPPNQKLVDVHSTVSLTDECDPNPILSLVSIDLLCDGQHEESKDPTRPDVVGASFGTPDVDFQLRAEKSPDQSCVLTYVIKYSGSDHSGNTAYATTNVIIPHDQSGNAAIAAGTTAPGGVNLASKLVVVIPSQVLVSDPSTGDDTRSAGGGTNLAGGGTSLLFNALGIDSHLIYFGNSTTLVTPTSVSYDDVDGDGFADVTATFTGSALAALMSLPNPVDDPLTLYYKTRSGEGYEVGSLFPTDGSTAAASLAKLRQNSTEAMAGDTPRFTRLSAPAPNPFTGSVAFTLELATDRDARVEVYDVRGARVRTLLSGFQPAGRTTLSWDGRDESGRRAPGGIYLVRAVAGSYRVTRKAVLMH